MENNDRVWSHSQKELYHLCRSKWHKQYVLDLKMDKPSEPLIFGGFVHMCLEVYLREKFIDFGQGPLDTLLLRDIIKRCWENTPELTTAANKKLAWQLVSKGLLTLSRDCRRILLLPNHRPAIELTVEIPLLYRGIVDLIYEDTKGRKVLLDWKTSSYPYRKHAVKNSSQLKGYAWLCEDGDLVAYDEAGEITFRQRLNVIPDYVAFCVLNKRDGSATLLKIRNDRDFVDITLDVKEVQKETYNWVLEPARSVSWYFRKNSSACFVYNVECPFYSICWSGDSREVKKISLVPTL